MVILPMDASPANEMARNRIPFHSLRGKAGRHELRRQSAWLLGERASKDEESQGTLGRRRVAA
jgi:hypothetical protein